MAVTVHLDDEVVTVGKRRYTKPCQFKGCYANAKAHGLCTGHLDQRARGKELTPLKRRRDVCDFPGCGRKHLAFGYCGAHREQMRKGQLAPIGQLLDRPLRAGESVHHRNLIKSDHRPENLELWTSHQPKGARVADMLAWCRWFLEQYGEEFPETR